MINPKHYAYRVIWSEEDQEYVGLCAEFPSLSWLAPEQEEAFAGIVSLVWDAVKDILENGEKLPEPFSNRRYSGKFMVRIPPDLHRKLVINSAEAGVSLNRYINEKLSF